MSFRGSLKDARYDLIKYFLLKNESPSAQLFLGASVIVIVWGGYFDSSFRGTRKDDTLEDQIPSARLFLDALVIVWWVKLKGLMCALYIVVAVCTIMCAKC